jgi:hypothetical protein
MKKSDLLPKSAITERTGRLFSNIGAVLVFILAARSIPVLSPESPFGWHALPDTLILLFGGWGILKGKRLVSIVLPAYALASRYIVNETLGQPGAATVANFIIFPAYTLGIIGAFAQNRAARIKKAVKDTRWIDADIATSFTRISGAAGLSFGILVGMFAFAEMGGFTWFNLTDAFLIILFAWYTLKRRLWAAASQVVLSFSSMALSYSQTGSFSALLGFIPLFIFELYVIGFIGAAVLRYESRPADRQQNIESGTGGPIPLTQDRPSPDLAKQGSDTK